MNISVKFPKEVFENLFLNFWIISFSFSKTFSLKKLAGRGWSHKSYSLESADANLFFSDEFCFIIRLFDFVSKESSAIKP